MQSSYLELAKQGTNKLQSYCYVLFSLILLTFLYFGLILIFSELEWQDLNDQNFQL